MTRARSAFALMIATLLAPAAALADEPLRLSDLQIIKNGPTRTPQKAPARLQGGEAIILCRVVEAKRLDACVVEHETPEGADVGKTLIRDARDMRLKPTAKDGSPIDGREVRLRTVYRSGKLTDPLICPTTDPADPTGKDSNYICTWRR